MKENTKKTNSINNNMLKEHKGITLIALIITIIILLILAGVTLNVALSENGLFKKSEEAVQKSKLAQYQEALEMVKAETYIDVNLDTNTTYAEKYKENLEKEMSKDNSALKGATSEYLDESQTILVLTTEDGNKFAITENGIEHKGNDESGLIKRAGNIAIAPKEDYGKVVTRFNSKTEGLTWRLWYVDNVDPSDPSKDTVYLISDFITTAQAPTKTVNGTTYSVIGGENEKCSNFGSRPENGGNPETGIFPAYTHNEETNNIGNASKWIWDNEQAIASKWLSKWYAYGANKTEGGTIAMEAVAYMMDSKIWTSSFKDTSNKADYVLGGPTVEMYCASYKDSHQSKYLETRIDEDTGFGYEYAWNENGTVDSYETLKNGVDTIGNNSIYALGLGNEPNVMWLASPITDTISCLGTAYNGNVGAGIYSNRFAGLCPIVCLKPGVQIERNGDGFKIK